MSHLTVVAEAADSPGRSAIQLMLQARAAGEQQVTALLRTLETAIQQAHEIVQGGEVYPAGVRDLAGKLAEHNAYNAQSIFAIMRPPTASYARFPLAAASVPGLEANHPADAELDGDFPDPECAPAVRY